MLDYSKIIFERKRSEEDAGYNRYSSLIPEYSHVEVGDCVMKIISENGSSKDIITEAAGFVRYPKWGVNYVKTGEPLFYITDNDNSLLGNWDKSKIRIDKDVLDGKYYYSLKGLPKKAIVDNGRVICSIRVFNDDPSWRIVCELVCQDIYQRKTLYVKFEEPFNVKLKNGEKGYGRGERVVYNIAFEDEGDGEYLCIRNFAIGYPKKSQIRQDAQPTPLATNAEESCFVYIMRNNDNGAYKIGISNNPKYRERTLQSQEPNITCIFQLEFESREKARAVEIDMHLKWAEFHIRGEWFAIPHERVCEVMADVIKCK